MLIFPIKKNKQTRKMKQNIKLSLLPALHCILGFIVVSHAPWVTWFMLATESYQKQFHAYTKELNLILNTWYFASKSTDKGLLEACHTI